MCNGSFPAFNPLVRGPEHVCLQLCLSSAGVLHKLSYLLFLSVLSRYTAG